MIWSAATGARRCGQCHRPMKRFEPMALLTERKLIRCVECVPDAEIDHAAVDAAKHDLEAQDAARTFNATVAQKGGARVLPGFSQATDAATQGLNQALKNFGIKGYRRSRIQAPKAPRPYAEVATGLSHSSEFD